MSDTAIFTLHDDPEHAREAACRRFEAVAAALRDCLPSSAEVRHVGATAVPGCLTKGDLDVVVRVPAAAFEAAERALAAMLARNAGSPRTTDFAAFEDDRANPHLGVQLTVIGGPYDDFHRFADALARSDGLRSEYNALKRRWHGRGMAGYRAAKADFVARVLALPWV